MAEGGKKKSKKQEGAPAWMVTYSDMVTLLLTFFVLLLSMANLDKIKFDQAVGSLKGAFGVLTGPTQRQIAKPTVVDFAPIEDDFVQRVYKRILTDMHRLKIDKEIELVKDRGAIVLRVNAAILFDSGKADLKPQAEPVLRHVADLIRPLPFQLRIEGHTDNRPFLYGRMSNWDMSVNRAVSVLKFFSQNKLLPLNRLSAVGYGAQRPIETNDTAEGRALNRRVEFVLESTGRNREELPYLIDAQDQLPF